MSLSQIYNIILDKQKRFLQNHHCKILPCSLEFILWVNQKKINSTIP
mgnify:CR=1 FL=1